MQHDTERSGSTFPFGAHVAVVEVDTETGRVVPVQHFAVDDCGVIVNPLLVDGQVHGGLASGIAQALWEQFLYDGDGNPITSTLAEYAIPSAAELPSFTTAHTETPSPLNELGRQGDRRVRHGRIHPRRAERGGRRAQPPRRPTHRHALHPRARLAGHQDARAGTLPDPWREPPSEMAAFPREGAAGEELERGAESVNL